MIRANQFARRSPVPLSPRQSQDNLRYLYLCVSCLLFFSRHKPLSEKGSFQKGSLSRDSGDLEILLEIIARARSTTTRDRNLQFRGAVSAGFFGIFTSGSFPFSPSFLCNLVRRSPPNVEKIARSRVVMSVAVMVFRSRNWDAREPPECGKARESGLFLEALENTPCTGNFLHQT